MKRMKRRVCKDTRSGPHVGVRRAIHAVLA